MAIEVHLKTAMNVSGALALLAHLCFNSLTDVRDIKACESERRDYGRPYEDGHERVLSRGASGFNSLTGSVPGNQEGDNSSDQKSCS